MNVSLTIAGLISFPILTRVLSVDDYGLMSLVALLLSLVLAVGKLGLQHSVLRFYGEVLAGKRADMPTFMATSVIGMTLVGIVVTLTWAYATQLVPSTWWADRRIPDVLLLTSVLVLVRVMESVWVNQLRAQERSSGLAVYLVAKRYAVLGAILIALFFISRDLWSYFGAMIVTEILALIALGVAMLRATPIHMSRFSSSLFLAMLAFGAPMIGTELSSIILAMGNRYVIQLYLGAESLGIYAAAYNLCDYVKAVLLAGMATAVLPMYLRIWEEQGPAETKQFLIKFFRVYFLVAFPTVAGITAVSGELLSVLASPKYREGAVVMPFVMAGMAFEAIVVAASAGLYVMKRTRTILVLIATAALVNIGLNAVLVPQFGLLGSALTTLFCWAGLAVVSLTFSARYLGLTVPLGSAAKFGALALVMYGAVSAVHLSADWATLIVRVIVGVVVYTAAAVAADRSTRELALAFVGRISGRSGAA